MIKHDPANGVFVDSGWQFSDLQSPAITPESWLAMLPAVVSQLDEAQREALVSQTLDAFNQAGVELAGCLLREFNAARWR